MKFCCDENSTLGHVNEEFGANHFRLADKSSDVFNPQQIESIKKLVQMFPGCDLWGSIPCGPWSNWQTVESEVRQAQSAMQKDSRFLLRKVLGTRIPTPTPYTQAFWISGAEATSRNVTCAKCSNKRRPLGLPALEATKCADSSGSPDFGYTYQNNGKCINCCAVYQGMRYLDYTNTSDNPDEATVYERLMQKELVGIVLALIDSCAAVHGPAP